MRRILLMILTTPLLPSILITPAYALDDSSRNRLEGVAVSVGLEYEQGDYGTPYTTKLWRIPFGLSYNTDEFGVGVMVPYLSATSNGTITIASHTGGHMTSGHTSSTSQSVSGIGDINVYAHYYLTTKKADLETYLTGRIKFGTADENKGLGTGATDYSIEFTAEKTATKQTYYGTIGYQISGDAAGINYDNVIYGDVGLRHELNKTQALGAEFNFSQAAVSGVDSYLDITGFMTTELDKKRDLYFYLQAGLTHSAPNFGAGVNLRYSF